MFEILLNTVKLVLSRETRDNARALIDLLRDSPEWEKTICTIDAKISIDEKERISLLRDLVVGKMEKMKYKEDACTAIKTIWGELADNAFEHGIKKSRQKIIRFVADICPTYIAITVYNPSDSSVDLASWFERGRRFLGSKREGKRGRGLAFIGRYSDTLSKVDETGVKAVVYKDRVWVVVEDIRDCKIIEIVSGYTNPSLGRRLFHFLQSLSGSKVVLNLEPNKSKNRESYGKALAIIGKGLQSLDERYREKLAFNISDSLFGLFLAETLKEGKVDIIVVNKDVERFLLPKKFVCSTVEQAIQTLLARQKFDAW